MCSAPVVASGASVVVRAVVYVEVRVLACDAGGRPSAGVCLLVCLGRGCCAGEVDVEVLGTVLTGGLGVRE